MIAVIAVIATVMISGAVAAPEPVGLMPIVV